MGIGTVVSSLLAIVFSIALVLGLAWGSLYLLKKWQDRALAGQGAGTGERTLRFVRALPLGPRERVVLVDTGDETLLLGVTAASITLLSRWDAAGELVAHDASAPPPVPLPGGLAGLGELGGKGRPWP